MKIRHTGNTYSKNSSTLITRYSEVIHIECLHVQVLWFDNLNMSVLVVTSDLVEAMESSVSIDKRHSHRDVNKWFHESFKNSK